jgi:hypothetical protein
MSLLLRFFTAVLISVLLTAHAHAVRIKELARVDGDREHRLVGYGLVVGLSGTGDSDKNRATRLALANALTPFSGHGKRIRNSQPQYGRRDCYFRCQRLGRGWRPTRRASVIARRCAQPPGRHADADAALWR